VASSAKNYPQYAARGWIGMMQLLISGMPAVSWQAALFRFKAIT
jgi:hypothetical protein